MSDSSKTPPGQATAPQPMTPEQLRLLTQSGVAQNLLNGSSGSKAGMKISPDDNIFLGIYRTPSSLEGPNRDIMHGGGTLDNNMSYGQARLLPSTWMESDPDLLKKFVTTGILNKVPGFDVGMGIGDIISAWDDLVKTSWEINQRSDGGKKWSPWDVLDSYSNPKSNWGTVRKGDWLYDAATGEKVKYVGPKTKTTTSRDVNLSSAEDVKALTTQVLTQALGRAPTSQEVAQYKSTINAQEQANPTMTTTTQTLNDMGEVSSQSSSTSGGFDSAAQQQLVQDQASKTPEYAKYQSGTTYWNALMSMLTGG